MTRRHNVERAVPLAKRWSLRTALAAIRTCGASWLRPLRIDYRVVLFDHVGAGGSDLSAYDPARYASLDGYADDVVELCRALKVTDGVFVGHSVSAMIGVLASKKAPELFDELS